MSTELANFFVPHQIATAVPLGPAPVDCNLAFSTSFIGTGLVLAVLYANLFKRGRHGRTTKNSFTLPPVQWIEYPNYVFPTLELFVEDEAPFGFSSLLSCPKDTEHLERAFDLLRYQHLSQILGVPSAVSRPSPLRSLRTLGNTSSGSSFDFWFSSQLLSGSNVSFAQGGPQESHGGSGAFMGEEKIAYTASYPKASSPTSARKTVLTALLAVSLAVLGFLAKRGLHYPSSSEPSTTPHSVPEILEISDDDNGPAKDKGCFGNCAPTTDIRPLKLGSRLLEPPVSKGQLDPYWAGISTDSLVVAIQVFCLLATRGRSHASSSEPYTIPSFDNIWELLEDDDSYYKSYIDKAFWNSAPVPSTRLVLGVLMNTEQLLLEDDPLSDSYTPYVALFFPVNDSHVWSDAALVEDDSAPVEFAAHFDALRDAFLWKTTEMSPLDVGRLVVFGMAIFLYIGLRVTVFLVTGRFGRRGLCRLVDQFKNKTLDPMLAAEIAHVMLPSSREPLIEAPETEPSAGGSESSDLTIPNDIFTAESGEQLFDQCEQQGIELIHDAFITPPPTTSTSDTLVDQTALAFEEELMDETILTASSQPSCSIIYADLDLPVETSLAPVVNEARAEVEGDGWTVVRRKRGKKGKEKATHVAGERDAKANSSEQVTSPPPTP